MVKEVDVFLCDEKCYLSSKKLKLQVRNSHHMRNTKHGTLNNAQCRWAEEDLAVFEDVAVEEFKW